MHYLNYINLKKGYINMINIVEVSKKKTKNFSNELLSRLFITKLTYKANKRGFGVSYKISPDTRNLTYCLIEKSTIDLNN